MINRLFFVRGLFLDYASYNRDAFAFSGKYELGII